jgi:hypothetical protein
VIGRRTSTTGDIADASQQGLGALAGGLLATTGLGTRGTPAAAGFGTRVATAPFLLSVIRRLERIPATGSGQTVSG